MEGRGRGEDPPLTFPCLLSSQLPRQTGAEMLVMQATLFLFLPLQKGARNSPEFQGKIPGFLGFFCSSYCGQIPGFPWKPRVTSWLSRLLLEYHSRLSKKAKNFLAFPAFSRPLRGKKAWKSQESQELRAFPGSPGFSGLFFAGVPPTIISLTTYDCLTIFLNCTQVCPRL